MTRYWSVLVRLLILVGMWGALSAPAASMSQIDATPPTTTTVRVVDVVSADGTGDTTGTVVCLSWTDSVGTPQDTCEAWNGDVQLATVPDGASVQVSATPVSGSDFLAYSSPVTASGNSIDVTISLQRAPADPTAPATEIAETPTSEPKDENAVGTPEPSESMNRRAAESDQDSMFQPLAVGHAQLDVSLVTPDGGAISEDTYICAVVGVDFQCDTFTGPTMTFVLPEGTATVSVFFPQGSAYANTTVTRDITAGTTTQLPIQLEARLPGALDVYLSTINGEPIPSGTRICLIGENGGEPICQTSSASPTRFSDLAEGNYRVEVTPRADSGYGPVEGNTAVVSNNVVRTALVIEPVRDSIVNITIRTADDQPVPSSAFVAVRFDNSSEVQTQGWNSVTPNADGSYTYTFTGPAGGFAYRVAAWSPDYIGTSGSGETSPTVPANIEVTLQPYEGQVGTVQLNVVTSDGGPIPEGTRLCYNSPRGDYDCVLVPANGRSTFPDVSAGNSWWQVVPPYGSGYRMDEGYLWIEEGETNVIDAVITAIDANTIEKTVSHEVAVPGQTITYTLSGQFTGSGLNIEDVLPAGVDVVNVTCTGGFVPYGGNQCYDLYGNRLNINGQPLNADMPTTFGIIITARVTAEADTTLTNQACMSWLSGSSPYGSAAANGFGVSAPVDGEALMQGGTTTIRRFACDSVQTRVVAPDAESMSFDKELVPSDDDVNGDGTARLGDVLTYRFTVTNTGTETLNGVRVEDLRVDSIECDPAMPATLAPGQALVCTGTHTVDEVDVARGTFVNTATAYSDQTPPSTDTVSVAVLSPVSVVAPTVAAVCGPDNDVVTIPEQPVGLNVIESVWLDGVKRVEFRPAVGVYIDGQSTWEFVDANQACPVTPEPSETVTPSPGGPATATPSPTATATSTPSPTGTVTEPATATVVPTETSTIAPGEDENPTASATTAGRAGSGPTSTPPVKVTTLPVTGSADATSSVQVPLLVAVSAVAFIFAALALLETRRRT